MARGTKIVFTDEDVLQAIFGSTSFSEVARKIGYANGSVRNTKTIQAIADRYNISTEHLKTKIRKCPICNRVMGREHRGITCSQECATQRIYLQYIARWKRGEESGIRGEQALSSHIRKYLFQKHHNSCEKCGWSEINPATNKIPLQVHHRDGNWSNNIEENLELLCPNCHSLTSTFMNSNKGSGRKNRYKTE